MAHFFHLTVAKVGENLFEGEAKLVTVPGQEGELTVLAEHEAFVSPLKAGIIKIEPEEGEVIKLEIESGIIEVSNNQATVLL